MRVETELSNDPISLLQECKEDMKGNVMKFSRTDQELLNLFYRKTKPVFDKYFPNELPYSQYIEFLEPCSRKELTDIEVQDGFRAFHLTGLEKYTKGFRVLDIRDLSLESTSYSHAGGSLRNDMIYRESSSPLLGYLDTFARHQASCLYAQPYYYFKEPDIIVFEYDSIAQKNKINMRLLCSHANDMSTSKITYHDSLHDLFMLDMMISLYPEMSHFDKIDTPIMSTDLKIDSWADAKSERDALIERFKKQYLNHRKVKLYRG